MNETSTTPEVHPIIENLATKVARNKADLAKWGLNLAVFLFGILITIIILTSQGVGISIVAPLAIAGLGSVWFIGWKRGRRLFQNFYQAELTDLTEKPGKETLASDMTISVREKEILTFVAQGQANKRIAIELGISEQTVKNHVTSVLRRLHAKDRTEAVVIAIKQGLISVS